MNVRRIAVVARDEAGACLRTPLYGLLVVALVLSTVSVNPAALVPSGDPSVEGGEPVANSRIALASVFALTSAILYGFVASLLAGASVLRDEECGIGDLLHATPLTPREYALGKLGGVLAAMTGALALHVVVAAAHLQLGASFGGGPRLGPFAATNYVFPALAFVWPSVWLHALLAFAVAVRVRRVIAVALVPIAIFATCVFFLWQWTPAWLPASVDRTLIAIDPSGLRWLAQVVFREDRGLGFYDTHPLPVDVSLVVNRGLVFVVPLVAGLASIPALRRSISRDVPSRAARDRTRETVTAASSTPPMSIAGLAMTTKRPGFASTTLAVASAELRELAAHPAVALFVPLVMFMTWESAATATAALDAPVLMTAGSLAVRAFERVSVAICLMLLFQVGESFERDDRTRLAPLLHTASVRTAALLSGKSLASFGVASAALIAALVTGVARLALQGGSFVELWPFVLVWGVVAAPSFLAWHAFVLLVAVIVRHRFALYGIGLAALGLSAWSQSRPFASWVVNWHLWGTLRWSDMGAFELYAPALALNRTLYAALAVALAAGAVACFRRTARDRLQRVRPARVRAPALAVLAGAGALALVVGLTLAGEVRRGFRGESAREEAREYRRRNLETWGEAPVPRLTHVDARLRIDPEERRIAVAGTYRLDNDTATRLVGIPFTVGRGFEGVAWSVDGEPAVHEERSGLHVVALSTPARPGGRLRVGFSYSVEVPAGSTRNGGGARSFVLPAGVFVHDRNDDVLPALGFDARRGVAPDARPEPAPAPDEFWKAELPPVPGIPRAFTARLEIDAPSALTVTAVGTKTAERSEDGRTTTVWETRHPVKALNVLAGRWAVRRAEGTAVYFHPEHTVNVEEISKTLVAARRRYSEWFAPYPWAELRVAEVPGYVPNAEGFPTNMPFSESIGFLARPGAEPSLPFVVTAHEAAHQWWGNLVTPGRGPGADVLIEGLAHYSTLLLIEAERGAEARRAFARHLEQNYLDERRVDAERPLAKIGEWRRAGDRTLVYDKGAWVLQMLERHLGRDAMLCALREFVREYRDGPDHPALQDFVAVLRAHGDDPEGFDRLVDQWIDDVVLPAFRVGAVRVSREGERWRVVAEVTNVGSGTVDLEVAVVGDATSPGRAPAASKTIRSAPRRPVRVDWMLDFAPRRIVVDPNVSVLQADRSLARADVPES